ncbi:MAG TPA: adenylate/guanylate cyclase domain-containing protein, partial [Acidimicrobiales bacterium]|nr:adenylate/guanylate cyclase domain-containing protein [Acidimicrobiales bacterium]
MTCPQCGAPSSGSARFCEQCGTALARLCAACGGAVAAGNRFCGLCGAPVGGDDGVTRRRSPPAVTERRFCSVLSADLVGFTPLAEGRDAEDVRELLSRYFEEARTVIGRYGGVVEKFIGDAVMAVWGTPVAVEGAAERAVRAAFDVVEAVAALGEEVGAPGLSARAGVVTGEVAVTVGATGEGMVAGDPVNTAARVQATAGCGAILVDEATARLAGPSIAFEDAGAHILKGKGQPVRLCRAVRVVSRVGDRSRRDGLEAPLCGRGADLRALKELLHAGAEQRWARLVSVTGEAGIGKSRLVWELEKYADGLTETVLWHRGRCLSYGDGVAYWALAEMVRQRFGIAAEDPAEAGAEKLAEGLTRFVPDSDERRYVGVRLGRLLGLPVAGDSGEPLGREELFAGWRIFFERLADVAPVVLVVEDAQHADPDLRAFLDHLVEWSRHAAILVVVVARTTGSSEAPLVGRKRAAVYLEPLDDAAMTALVEGLVPGLPPDAVSAVVDRAEGIPLFAVETVRALLDAGQLAKEDGEYVARVPLGALAVPDSLYGLLAARLDALDPLARSLVADAAVLGGAFSAEALAAVSGCAAVDVREGLGTLVRREILEVSADPRSPRRGTYRFSQGLIRQVAYETLSRRDRKARHLAVAGHLRASFPDDGEEVADVVARHYLDAIEADPDAADVPELRAEALAILIRAGERAERAGAPARAAASFAAAADLSEPGPAAALWERASTGWWTDADYGRSLEAAEHACRRHAAAGDARAAGRARVLTARALGSLGRRADERREL